MFDGLMPQPIRKAVAILGDGANTHYLVNHDLNTQDLLIQVWQADLPHSMVHCAATAALSPSSVLLQFGTPPAVNAYRVVLIG